MSVPVAGINACLSTALLAGGLFLDSLDGDDAASESSGMEPDEDPSSSAAGRGGPTMGSLRRKGVATPPATPSTSRGGQLLLC